MNRQHLIFDADDTLWENNIYFEEAFERFCEHLAHSRLTPDEVRALLDEIEIRNNQIHGYGTRNFARNLCQCFASLVERESGAADMERVSEIAHAIFESPMELMEGVAETLPLLAERHELTLFTKGDPEEQWGKIERSGLQHHFAHCEVVKEKNRAAYERLAESRELDHDRTWMIGNSPKSDINPALAAGLGAVWVPHERTWTLERAEIEDAQGRLVQVNSFRELTDVFL